MTHQQVVQLVTLGILVGVPLILHDEYLLRVLTNIFYFGALGTAWNLIGGFAGQLSLGHAALFSLSAYATGLLFMAYGITPIVGFIAGVICSLLGAVVMGYPCFRLRGPYFALATLSFNEIVRILLLYFRNFTYGSVGLTLPFRGSEPMNLRFVSAEPYYYLALGILLASVYASFRIYGSRLGYYLGAIRNDHDAAEALGVDLMKTKMTALLISAGLTGVVAVFYTVYIGYLDPDSVCSIDLSIKIALIGIIGGMGSVWGPALGAGMLIPMTEVSNALFGSGRAGASMILYGVLMIGICIFSPRGLIVLLEGVDRTFWRNQPNRE